MYSYKTETDKLIDRINNLKELPRTDNVQSIINRLEQELEDLCYPDYERDCYSY